MKAIIVLDLSDSLIKEWDTDTSKCWADIRVYTPIKGGAHGIGCVYASNYVELKPMPQKLDANDWHRMFSGLFSEREAKGYGWNACVDEILGADDD